MSDSRGEATASRTEPEGDARALIDRYFACVAAGDAAVAELLADDVVWFTPRSSPLPGPFVGKPAVLELMASAVDLYDPETPLDIRRGATAATGDRVFVELEIHGRTRAGEAYENDYVFAFTVRAGRIVEVHEHLDTLYAQRKLFDPAGRTSPLG